MNTPTAKLRETIFQLTRNCKDNACVLCWAQVDDILQACKDAGLRFPKIDLSGKTLLIPIDLQEAQK